MALENTWVTYLQRSYKSIKASILNRMETLVPEISDYSESNIFVIIVSQFAGLVEQLNYYIDNVAREMYITTARRYSSMVKLTRLIDYRVMAKVSSTVDLLVTAIDSNGLPYNVNADVTISSGSIIKTSANTEFITTENRTIFIGNPSVVIPARQGKVFSNVNIGTTSALPNQVFKLDVDYRHDTLQITINAITWELRQTFAFSGPSEKHFIVEVNDLKEAWVVFGNNVNGNIPPTGQSVLATFEKSTGLSGNVEADTISTWVTGKPVTGGAYDYTVTNPISAMGGLDVEDIEGIRKHAPLSLRTMDRAVTLQDHIDIALLTPGVGKTAVEYNPTLKTVYLYIAPEGGGIASTQLCTDVVNFFSTRKIISTIVSAVPCGETILRIDLTATAKFRRSASDTTDDIEAALLMYFGFNYSDVNKAIHKSDIISLIDNLDKVDFLALNSISTKPYPRISIGTHEISATWYAITTYHSIEKAKWRLFIQDASARTVRLYRIDPITNGETFDKSWTYPLTDPGSANITSVDGSLELAIYGTFTNGDEWLFTTYAYNEDIEFDDFTIPITKATELTITVNEQQI